MPAPSDRFAEIRSRSQSEAVSPSLWPLLVGPALVHIGPVLIQQLLGHNVQLVHLVVLIGQSGLLDLRRLFAVEGQFQ